MTKRSLYKKLVCQFESTINNYQDVNAEFDFNEFKTIISNQKKDNRYYKGIQQFLDYLREQRDKNALIFIFPELRKKYQRFLEKVETLLTARPLEASRQTRSTNNCVIEDPKGYRYNDSFNMEVYLDDLQNSKGFSEILKRKQSIEFKFNDTIFILSKNCISRQTLEKKPDTLSQSDYRWFLSSMTIYFLRNKLRAVAHEQELSQQNDAAFSRIIKDICLIDSDQQDNSLLKGVDNLENFAERELGNFIFNSKYVRDTLLFSIRRGNSSNFVSDVDKTVSLKITALKNSQQKTDIGIASHFNSDNSQALPENHSIISNATSSISHRSVDRSLEGFNWMIIVSAAGGIGIVFIVVMIIWYIKKNRSENSGLATEHIPLLNSVSDDLHVQKIAVRLKNRLKFLKKLDRYEDEIGVHYTSLLSLKSKKDVIDELKKIQGALIKFLKSKKSSNKAEDEILSNKLNSALLIVDSLIQRYNLLSLPMHNSSENDYITDQLKSALTNSINSMLINIEFIRDNYKGPYKTEKDELEYFGSLISLEKVVYDAILSAHAEGYFEKYSQEQIKTCLKVDPNTKKDSQECELPKPNTNIKDIQECELQKIKNLQNEALSTLKIIKESGKNLAKHLSKSNETNFYGLADSIVTQSDSMTSQLLVYFTHYNTRREILNKQAQASVENGSSTFFVQPKSPKTTNLSRKCTM